MNKLEILKKKAKGIVLHASETPQNRYKLRYEFYQKYGEPFIKGKEGLGNSELAFMDWEIKRGTLNSINAQHPGSLWWRSVNSHFLYLGTLAQLIYESGETFPDLPVPVNFWLQYIHTPDECSWYHAHNSSIIAGYQVADSLAFKENIYEQYFMNIVLYRVLYAQSMVEGVSFGILGEIFSNPRGAAVSILTDIEAFYPSHYPLSKKDIEYVTHRAHNLNGLIEDIFDKLFIIPHLDELYTEAAKWNKSPIVLEYIKNNKPLYPISESEFSSAHFNTKLITKKIHTL
ncbi:hypothetical protein IWQ47_001241 [Aquimarina sp. EL_43]|uniref:hypothetical protein n=1 Tax=unclassified Aquimarina TaxID=2627091 RepID=UPI0018CA7C9E|nr:MULTISPECIES: hypothetical protein [unclassified Aquimarina]MBG6129456.1 hypothetical protein [Aquimarina sp. EL_35]MBG6150521.1 hypothetical protein [Aquimarina sp. EL_32]MBG6168171.1 hypothetical protein [Aquimarina sp. EL_43]